MNAHDRDKITALLKSVATECETKGSLEHSWRKCRHCLAVAELEHGDIRKLIGELAAEGAISSPASQYDIRLMTDFQIVEILKARAAHDANNEFGRWIGRLLTAWVTDSPLADIDKILSERTLSSPTSQGKHD